MKRWDIDDEVYLEIYYNDKENISVQDASEILPGTKKNITSKASALRKEGVNIRYMRKRWTDKEDDYIRKHYKTTPYAILAMRFSVTEKAIKERIRYLGLPRKLQDMTIYDSEIRELAKRGLSRKEIASVLGLKESQVQGYVIRNEIDTIKLEFKNNGDTHFRQLNRLFRENIRRKLND